MAFVGLTTRCASQPAALCEAFRLAEGPWALPRPPEWERRESWWAAKILMQERGESANAVDGGEGGSVVARLQMGGLIVEELAGRCQCVSRWPEYTAASYCWRKGHPDLVHPDVVLAAFALGGRVRRSGHYVRPLTTELFLGSCRWRGDLALLVNEHQLIGLMTCRSVFKRLSDKRVISLLRWYGL